MELKLPPSEYELIIGDLKERHAYKERIFFLVALAVLSALVVILMLRPAQVHTIERWSVIDKSTGYIQRFAELEDLPMTDREKHTRNHVNMYLLYHETYGPSLASDKDMVRRFSAPDVWDAYWDHTYNYLYDVYQASLKIRVVIDSLVLENDNTATVVYRKVSRENRQAEDTTCWTTTISFEYRSMDGQPVRDVDMNPDGFHVTDWRAQQNSRCPS